MMKEILITSSALILALLIIRRVFKGVLSRRFQYALWGLVLVRLLVPVNLLPASDFSVLSATRPVEQAVADRVNQPLYFRPQGQVSQAELSQRDIPVEDIPTAQDGFVLGVTDGFIPEGISSPTTTWLVRDPETNTVTRYNHMTVGPWDFLDAVWKAGMVLMGGFFLLSNLAFYLKLRKNRKVWRAGSSRPTLLSASRKVYLVPDGVLPSPCLFGRAIYITPAVAGDENKLRHVLSHEETHARHLDPLWSLLRCLCLTVYWFDPLVWVAAACSKADCELACDESVLRTLGEEERIPYGQTLLSLIPVKRVGNPMLAATTMTAGKKQLKDRVSRIARRPRQLAAAALAVAVLAGVASACTFTGAKPEPAPGPTGSQEPQGLRALTGEELRWFNEEFFNRDPNPAISYTYSIRNQFLNASFNLYERPEDIDLYQLFYVDGSVLSEAEYRAVFGVEEMFCPAFKLTAEEMDGILLEYTGLTLEQTNKVGLENFTYQDGAYYWMHGDTNYPGEIEIICGTREGSTVKLYHHGWSSGYEWYETTLTEQSDGSYWFISNRESGQPIIPTPLPAWEPEAVVSLKDIEPYTAPAVVTERHEGDFVFSYENNLQNWDIDGHHIRVYRSTDGAIYAAEELEDGSMNVFAQYSFDDVDMFFFHDLFGRDGFYITYQPGANSRFYSTDTDYYYFDESGALVLLARCHGESRIIDLDGDGQNELVAPRQLFLLQDGVVYEAWLDELLLSACPELSYWDYSVWDKYGKCLYVRGYTEDYKEWERYLYFDGESILVYKNEKPTVDHMVEGIADGVPAIVVEKSKEAAEAAFTEANVRAKELDGDSLPEFDTWRISGFYGPYTKTLGGVTIQGWSFGSEGHTNEPEKVVLAGARTLSEDNWTSPGPWDTPNIIFLRQEEDGSLTYLWTGFDDGTLDSYGGTEGLLLEMEKRGVELAGGYSYAQLHFQMRLEWITQTYYDYQKSESSEMRIQYDDGQGHGGAYMIDPQEGNGPYYLNQMKDNYVVWSRVEAPADTPAGATVSFSDGFWYEVLQFWQDSSLVMYKQQHREPEWYEVKYDGDPAQDVFAYRAYPYYWARCWFDEAQWNDLTGGVAIPDEGQSRQAIAQAWVDAYEGTKLHTAPGGHYTCTYVKNIQVKTEELAQTPESWFPEEILAYDHFRFSYSTIFVPENTDAQSYMMAGNTVEYEGTDPSVPSGAFQYWLIGSMYLKDGYWYCSSLGTG